jgi:hypothetical protein
MSENVHLSDDGIVITSEYVRLDGSTFQVSEIHDVTLEAHLPKRYVWYSRWAGVASGLLFLSFLTAYITHEIVYGSEEAFHKEGQDWLVLFFCVFLFGLYATMFSKGMVWPDRISCFQQVLGFFLTALVGSSLLFLLNKYIDIRPIGLQAQWPLTLPIVMVITSLATFILLATVSSLEKRRIYVLRLTGSFGALNALSSPNEDYVRTVAVAIKTTLGHTVPEVDTMEADFS